MGGKENKWEKIESEKKIIKQISSTISDINTCSELINQVEEQLRSACYWNAAVLYDKAIKIIEPYILEITNNKLA